MRHAFDAALERAERNEAEAHAPPPGFPGFAPPLAAAPEAPTGHHSLWEFAAAWTPEADPPAPPPAPAPPPPPPRPSARAQDIAAELGLDRLKTAAELAYARRRFMWNNHPDRRGDLDRDLANRRVALANMLLDRALAALRQRRGR
jgi:hypothetical protein